MNVIFLDFDGVLDTACYDFFLTKNGKPSCDINGRPVFDPRCIRNLKKILDVTLAKIVVTSSWRQFDTLPELRDMWQEREMPGEILDVTPIISDNRGEEIDQWLSGRAEGSINYIIIDDLPPECFNSHQISRLIQINPLNGLTTADVMKAINVLDF